MTDSTKNIALSISVSVNMIIAGAILDHRFLKPEPKEIIIKVPVNDSLVKKCEALERVITQQQIELNKIPK